MQKHIKHGEQIRKSQGLDIPTIGSCERAIDDEFTPSFKLSRSIAKRIARAKGMMHEKAAQVAKPSNVHMDREASGANERSKAEISVDVNDEKLKDQESEGKRSTDSPLWHRFCLSVVQSRVFKIATVVGIIGSMSLLFAEIVQDWNSDTIRVFLYLEFVFFVSLGIEVCIRMGSSRKFFKMDVLLFLDILVLGTFLLNMYLLEASMLGRFLPFGIRIIRGARMLRMLRFGRFIAQFPLVMALYRDGATFHSNFSGSLGVIVVFWLVFAVITRSVLGKMCTDETVHLEEDARTNSCRYFGTFFRAFRTAISAPPGGMYWGDDIVRTFMLSKVWWYPAAAVLLLLSLLFARTCLSNLVLGIYLRQMKERAEGRDEMSINQEFSDGTYTIHMLREILEERVTDDECLQFEQFSDCLNEKPVILEILNISREAAEIMFKSLDSEGCETINLNTLIFRLLKLSGQSKEAIDMLSIDYRQQVLLRQVHDLATRWEMELSTEDDTEESPNSGHLDSKCRGVGTSLHALVNEAITYAKVLHEHIEDIANIQSSGEVLLQEIHHEEDALMDEARRSEREHMALVQARRVLEDQEGLASVSKHLVSLENDVVDLLANKRLRKACAGGKAEMDGLRKLVRQHLDTKLRPWFERELLQMGFCRVNDPLSVDGITLRIS
eukprot:TRINITY_DN10034_c0_g1_i6.p1 TRINITY_DN10034_c0_g1~~TRINITY_DN10034_c0_g1_i6.p1  ORF type:complete len:694 (-),score=90.18 TRINITY_DN10034_c0_g1_i6:22-2022(-)